MKIMIYMLMGVLLLLIIALWLEPPNYKIGDKIIIKDCVLWSLTENAGSIDTSGLKVRVYGDRIMLGRPLGEHPGIVKQSEVVRRKYLRPVYRYLVEFRYATDASEVVKIEWYQKRELEKG